MNSGEGLPPSPVNKFGYDGRSGMRGDDAIAEGRHDEFEHANYLRQKTRLANFAISRFGRDRREAESEK